MALQTQNGKSFEYAVALALQEVTNGKLIVNPSLKEAESNFSSTSVDLQNRQMSASRKGVLHLREIGEIEFADAKSTEIRLSTDASGQKGDVRDVVISDHSKSVGISCKNNHRAFKHSRLSASIDFVKKWNLDPEGASREYWSAVLPIFQNLRTIKNSSDGKATWNGLDHKQENVYSPILSAFENEIKRLLAEYSGNELGITKNFIDYVVGKQDFFKFIVTPENIEIIGFNFHKTLHVLNSKYPTRIHSIERDPAHPTTSILRFQEGHTFSFRIHNASSKIEPSLKFDIQALSLPQHQVYSHHISL